VITLVSVGDKSCMLVVDMDAEGVSVSEPDKKLGNRGELTYDIYYDNVEVPEENLIAEEGDGLKVCVGALMYGRTGIGASGVGMAQSAFDECVRYMEERESYGKKLNRFQHWQFLMAERAVEIENARNLYLKSARRIDSGEKFPVFESSGAKFYGSKVSVDMARDAVQIFGGYGLMVELAHDKSTYKVEEIYRDSKVGEIYEGANEVHKMLVAREIFGK
jgi:alkylation response protein AidB-like acyl-CoA dehydrogenase